MKILSALSFASTLLVGLAASSEIESRIEDGLAITHPRVLTTLQERASGMGIGVGYYFDPSGQNPPKIANNKLSELKAFKPVMASLRHEIALFTKENNKKRDTVGVGVNYHHRLFDIRFLEDDRASFALVGVVNRMDQAHKSPETCGETRLIFRLAYRVELDNGGEKKSVSSRLPLTLNLVLNTKSPDSLLTCAEIAKRWQELNIEGLSVARAVDRIFAQDGVLAPELRDRTLINRLEINLQIARKAAAVRPDFGGHAIYLLKVYNWNHDQQVFEESKLANQVDRQKAKDIAAWLFERGKAQTRLRLLDLGTIQIPEKFLDVRAYSLAPGGLSRIKNHVLEGVLSDAELDSYLDKVDLSEFENIKSVAGLKRRLTDIGCNGCHQTRAIGGFHFMGQDPYRWEEDTGGFSTIYPGNSVIVPGSGHFFGDLPRRREVIEAFVKGEVPDFSTGFSSRPQDQFARELEGEGIYNGWGAHCHTGRDASFKNWTCSEGFRCLELYKGSPVAENMGICVSKSGMELGDPTEVGVIKKARGAWHADVYTRKKILPLPAGSDYVNSPQSPLPGTQTGGFPGGAIRTNSCASSVMRSHPEGLCGALPAGGNGFNNCIFNPNKSFSECVQEYSKGVGLRGCSREKPCRDDYICAQSFDTKDKDAGVCVPPYFLFQFRVDGHPIKF